MVGAVTRDDSELEHTLKQKIGKSKEIVESQSEDDTVKRRFQVKVKHYYDRAFGQWWLESKRLWILAFELKSITSTSSTQFIKDLWGMVPTRMRTAIRFRMSWQRLECWLIGVKHVVYKVAHFGQGVLQKQVYFIRLFYKGASSFLSRLLKYFLDQDLPLPLNFSASLLVGPQGPHRGLGIEVELHRERFGGAGARATRGQWCFLFVSLCWRKTNF